MAVLGVFREYNPAQTQGSTKGVSRFQGLTEGAQGSLPSLERFVTHSRIVHSMNGFVETRWLFRLRLYVQQESSWLQVTRSPTLKNRQSFSMVLSLHEPAAQLAGTQTGACPARTQ